MLNDKYRRSILSEMRKRLSPARFKHTLGVEKIAVELASHFGYSQNDAATAALLHDIGKFTDSSKMISYVRNNNLKIPLLSDVLKYNPALLHSYVSAHIAHTKFNVKNRNILNAIAQHTIGSKKMRTLSKIIYLADAIAPDRRHPMVKSLRHIAFRDLSEAVYATMQVKFFYVIKNQKWIHPHAVASWNAIRDEVINAN